MMRIPTLTALIAATFYAGLRGAEVPVDPASMPAELARIQSEIARAGPVACNFAESRTFPFKKTPTVLEGESEYIPGQGIVLRYETPEKQTLGIRSDGIIEIDSSGAKKLRQLPRQYENLMSVYDLDIRRLADDFYVFFDEEGGEWTIRLAEKQELVSGARRREAKGAPVGITIRGAEGSVRSLEIAKTGAITVVIDMGKARAMTPEESASALKMLKQ